MERKLIADQEYGFKELTVGEVDQLLSQAGTGGGLHVIDLLFHDRLPVAAVALITNRAVEQFEVLRPSEYLEVLAAAEAANPTLLPALERLARIGREISTGIDSPKASAP